MLSNRKASFSGKETCAARMVGTDVTRMPGDRNEYQACGSKLSLFTEIQRRRHPNAYPPLQVSGAVDTSGSRRPFKRSARHLDVRLAQNAASANTSGSSMVAPLRACVAQHFISILTSLV
jgi:hypothetical protein